MNHVAAQIGHIDDRALDGRFGGAPEVGQRNAAFTFPMGVGCGFHGLNPGSQRGYLAASGFDIGESARSVDQPWPVLTFRKARESPGPVRRSQGIAGPFFGTRPFADGVRNTPALA